jgi:hypothetical protein
MPPCCTTGRHSLFWTFHPSDKEDHEKKFSVCLHRVVGSDTCLDTGRMLPGTGFPAVSGFNLGADVDIHPNGDDCSGRHNCTFSFDSGTIRGVCDSDETDGCDESHIWISADHSANRRSCCSIYGSGDEHCVHNCARRPNCRCDNQQDGLPDVSYFRSTRRDGQFR